MAMPALLGPDEVAAVGLGLLVPDPAGTVITTVCPGAVTMEATVPEGEGELLALGSGALPI